MRGSTIELMRQNLGSITEVLHEHRTYPIVLPVLGRVSKGTDLQFLCNLVGHVGFEPTTLASQTRCANQAALMSEVKHLFQGVSNLFLFLQNEGRMCMVPKSPVNVYETPDLYFAALHYLAALIY